MAIALTYNLLLSQIQSYLARYDSETVNKIPWFINWAEITLCRMPKHLGIKRVVVSSFTKDNPVVDKPAGWRSTVSINYGTGDAATTLARLNASGVRTVFFETPHPFVVGSIINVSGLGGSGYNGTGLAVTATTPLTVTYISGTGTEAVTSDAGGYVTTTQDVSTQLLPRGYEFCKDYWPNASASGNPLFYANYNVNHFFIVPTPAQAFPFELTYYERPTPLSESVQTNFFTQNTPDALLYGSLLQAVPYLKNDERIETWKKFYDMAINGIEAEALDNLEDAEINRVKGK